MLVSNIPSACVRRDNGYFYRVRLQIIDKNSVLMLSTDKIVYYT